MTLLEWFETTVFLLNSWAVQLLDIATEQQTEIEELESEKIADLNKLISLQETLIIEKVESELESYLSVLQKSCSETWASRKIAAAVKSVVEIGWSTNVIDFGVPEEDSESVDSKVMDLLEHQDEKPKEQTSYAPNYQFQSAEL